jgi:hypothetical protein
MPEPRDPLLKVLTIKFVLRLRCILGFQILRRECRRGNRGIVDKGWEMYPEGQVLSNDPSAGSPTETLLRLLLPLNDQVWTTFQL